MPGEKLTDNADRHNWPKLISRQPLVNEFKSDLLTPFDHCAV